MQLQSPLTQSVQRASHQSEEFFFVFVIVIVYGLDVELGILKWKIFDHVQETQLTDYSDLLVMIHSLADHCLNAVESAILVLLPKSRVV